MQSVPIDRFVPKNHNHRLRAGRVSEYPFSAMRLTRQIFAVAILALYIAQMVGGRVVCSWQHSGNGSCCSNVDCETATNRSYHHDGEDCNHDRQQDGPSPGENRQHDSSTCWVCQVLNQAQNKPIELEATVVLAVAPVTAVVLPDFCLAPGRSGFQSRAPPVIWA